MKKITIIIAAVLFTIQLNAQTGVSISNDNSDPDNSAMLDVQSTDKGILLPRMTEAERDLIANPATGLMIFQTDGIAGFYYNAGTPAAAAWTAVSASGGATHYVGELYGGGVVFWVDNTGEHGLICSMVDISTSQAWSDVTSTTVPGGALSDWDGQTNSTNIIAQSTATSAADICANYTNADYGTGTHSDWYLPSVGELNHVWNNFYEVQKALDGSSGTTMARTYYWSSTEYVNTTAWSYAFNPGYSSTSGKGSFFRVRAVRAF